MADDDESAIDVLRRYGVDIPDDDDGGNAAQTTMAHAAAFNSAGVVPLSSYFLGGMRSLASRTKNVVRSLSLDEEGGENTARKYLNRVLNSALTNSIWSKKFWEELEKMGGNIWAELWADLNYTKSKNKKQRDAFFDEVAKLLTADLFNYGATKKMYEEFGLLDNKPFYKAGNLDGWVFDKIAKEAKGVDASVLQEAFFNTEENLTDKEKKVYDTAVKNVTDNYMTKYKTPAVRAKTAADKSALEDALLQKLLLLTTPPAPTA